MPARRRTPKAGTARIGRTTPCGVALLLRGVGIRSYREQDRQRSARVNRWELVCGCVSQLALCACGELGAAGWQRVS